MVAIGQGFEKMGISGVRVNQALSLAGKTISRLRPDVQFAENGLIHIVEVSTLNGAAKTAYHLERERIFKGILGPLFGTYRGV